jgi:hypothetical protein
VLRQWAERNVEVRALALVGSQARGDAGLGSDVDFVAVVPAPEGYQAGNPLGHLPLFCTAKVGPPRRWGVQVERRFLLEDGLEIDLGFVPVSWASNEPG